jgi:flavin reductase (DIM6/NTAB) family NADH-FMN oxidoreductase RutF
MDAQAKKAALRSIQYGLQVLTSIDGEELAAAGVNWLSQASFEPPLIMIAVKNDNDSHAIIERSGVLAINVLAENQLDIGKAFSRTTKVEGDTLNGYHFEPGAEADCPILTDLPYWFEARVTDTVARGDHTIFVAEVVNAGERDDAPPPLLLRSTGMNYGG